MYSEADHLEAIKFALNYPPEVELLKYDMYKDIYKVRILDDGWYEMRLQGAFVRSCLKFKGEHKWQKT